MFKLNFLLCVTLFCFFSASLEAKPKNSPQTFYGPQLKEGMGSVVSDALAFDDYFIVLGSLYLGSEPDGRQTYPALWKLSREGQLDQSFGENGIVWLNSKRSYYKMRKDSQGNIYVAGLKKELAFSEQWRREINYFVISIAKFNAQGESDRNFSNALSSERGEIIYRNQQDSFSIKGFEINHKDELIVLAEPVYDIFRSSIFLWKIDVEGNNVENFGLNEDEANGVITQNLVPYSSIQVSNLRLDQVSNIYIQGETTLTGAEKYKFIIRLDFNGRPDTSFGFGLSQAHMHIASAQASFNPQLHGDLFSSIAIIQNVSNPRDIFSDLLEITDQNQILYMSHSMSDKKIYKLNNVGEPDPNFANNASMNYWGLGNAYEVYGVSRHLMMVDNSLYAFYGRRDANQIESTCVTRVNLRDGRGFLDFNFGNNHYYQCMEIDSSYEVKKIKRDANQLWLFGNKYTENGGTFFISKVENFDFQNARIIFQDRAND